MPPVGAGPGTRQVAIHVHELRARDVRRTISALAGIDVGEIVAAIDDHPRRVRKTRGKLRRRYQSCVFHRPHCLALIARAMTPPSFPRKRESSDLNKLGSRLSRG